MYTLPGGFTSLTALRVSALSFAPTNVHRCWIIGTFISLWALPDWHINGARCYLWLPHGMAGEDLVDHYFAQNFYQPEVLKP